MQKKSEIVIKHVGTWVLIVLLAQMSPPIFAQGQYELSWYTIDGGGGTSSGGPYTLVGTIGQPDTGWSAGGEYEVLGGFWSSAPTSGWIIGSEQVSSFGGQRLQAGSRLNSGLGVAEDVGFEDLCRFADEWLKYKPNSWPLS
jgi:hypothetical protein